MLDELEFACLCERWQTSLGTHVDADLIGKMFRDYYAPNYNNYTLLELIYELHIARVQILCQWNKKAIIDMIKEFKIDIPEKRKPSSGATEWQHNTNRSNGSAIDTIFIYDCDIEFREGDVIQLQDGIAYEINLIEYYDVDTVDVCLKNIMGDKWLSGEQFVQMLDNDPDVTILQCMDKYYYM